MERCPQKVPSTQYPVQQQQCPVPGPQYESTQSRNGSHEPVVPLDQTQNQTHPVRRLSQVSPTSHANSNRHQPNAACFSLSENHAASFAFPVPTGCQPVGRGTQFDSNNSETISATKPPGRCTQLAYAAQTKPGALG